MRFLWMMMTLVLFSFPVAAAEFSAGLQLGHVGGTGGQVQLGLADFAQGLPGGLRLTGAFAGRDAGNPEIARRVFINNNTNGTPDESGEMWLVGLDWVVPLTHLGTQPVQLFLGPRRAGFTGNFEYIGGNEIFEITTTAWGWGMGLESRFPMGRRVDLVVSGGLDWFNKAEISGHDTSYLPDGTDVNGREDYGYEDAEEAVNRPDLEPRLLLGVTWSL